MLPNCFQDPAVDPDGTTQTQPTWPPACGSELNSMSPALRPGRDGGTVSVLPLAVTCTIVEPKKIPSSHQICASPTSGSASRVLMRSGEPFRRSQYSPHQPGTR